MKTSDHEKTSSLRKVETSEQEICFLPEYIHCGNSAKQQSRCQKCKSVQKAIWQTHGRDTHWGFSKQKYLWLQKSLDSQLEAGRIEQKKHRISLCLKALPGSHRLCQLPLPIVKDHPANRSLVWLSVLFLFSWTFKNQVSLLFTHLI